jgi:hypothetical protein
MDQRLYDLLENADWTVLTPKLENYADSVLRRYLWRGFRLGFGSRGQLLAAGKSADDFVMEAINALLHGPREYNFELSLERNLQRTIESSIWNWKKRADRQSLVDHEEIISDDGIKFDPIETAVDPRTTNASEVQKLERRTHQKLLLDDFEASLKEDQELSNLIEAYKSGFTKPADIEQLTAIPAARVSELKRKLATKLNKFVRNHSSAESAEF